MCFAIRDIKYVLGKNEIIIREKFPEFVPVIIKTGIEKVFETNGSALDLGVEALDELLGASSLLKSSIGCLIYVTQSQTDFLPSGACVLQDRCGLPNSIMAFDMSQGCSGFVQALSIAANLLNTFENIVIVCADTYRSKLDVADRATSPLFSDGASATWISRDGDLRVVGESHTTDGSGRDFLYHRIPTTETKEFLHMSGADVLLFSKRVVSSEIVKVLEKCSLDISEIDNWYFHQASKVVLDGLEQRFKTPKPFARNLQDIGNTVSSSIPILLHTRLAEVNSSRSLLCGFGVGLSTATMVLEKS